MTEKLTAEQALARFMEQTREELAETCCDSHKDFYGIKGRYMLDWEKERLQSWWTLHFRFDEAEQVWSNIVSFEGEDPFDQEYAVLKDGYYVEQYDEPPSFFEEVEEAFDRHYHNARY